MLHQRGGNWAYECRQEGPCRLTHPSLSITRGRQWLADALKENDPSSVLLFLVGSKKDLSVSVPVGGLPSLVRECPPLIVALPSDPCSVCPDGERRPPGGPGDEG